MIWLFVGVIAAMAVVGVAAWARRSRKRVDDEAAQRRTQSRLDAEEQVLLAKLRSRQTHSSDEKPPAQPGV